MANGGEANGSQGRLVEANGDSRRKVARDSAVIAPKERNYEYEWAYEGEIVICPWHSLEYHIPTGRCLTFPDRKLPVYEVRVQADELRIVL